MATATQLRHAASDRFGDGSSAWARDLGERLLHAGPAPVLEVLAGAHPRGNAQKKLLRQTLQYFTGNATRMDYPTYAARGWPLGSGIVESTCRLLSNLPTKEPGMRWSHGGVQEILTLRAVRLSAGGAWNAFWAAAPHTRRPPVRTLTHAKHPPAQVA